MAEFTAKIVSQLDIHLRRSSELPRRLNTRFSGDRLALTDPVTGANCISYLRQQSVGDLFFFACAVGVPSLVFIESPRALVAFQHPQRRQRKALLEEKLPAGFEQRRTDALIHALRI